ncbi:MAG: acyl carrier protein [Candidatus Scalindua sp. AMX11]|nr:MAG: acyl carrier protein [Candidatus Scalindua sp.]NOG82686.1 acyl carrier protein [Planctomycetota bacterium]RZV95260.1 MAG: acyl carrier protein [Candidatus Scalindua sp. SCAELEC01]TDE66260.1 MAG: acyl carrier protein [Candidatus Scalindua sp. AMX11]GJQ57883.1 MAG: acyl carrier protein [Candidatus Scalindua sp.]
MDEHKLRRAFVDALDIEDDNVVDSLEYGTVKEWDSIGHMKLISEIELNFDIMIDTDDVIAMNTFGRAKDIVKKYSDEN